MDLELEPTTEDAPDADPPPPPPPTDDVVTEPKEPETPKP